MRTYRQVTGFEPKVAAFLARHAERLLAPTPPRGLWACEEDGEPIILLTVYTEPRIRVSAIIDHPETRPAASLTRLVQEFERWAVSVGATSYGVVIDRADDQYCKIIERRGGLLMGTPTGPWVEYLHEIDQAPNVADGIRPWRPSDWKALRPVIRDALHAPGILGESFLPTRKNIESFIRIGVKGAAQGEPCLLAYEGGVLQGVVLCTGHHGPFDHRERVCSAVGLYVIHGAPTDLRARLQAAALDAAWRAGYTRVDGIVLSPAQLSEWKALGATAPGMIVHVTRPRETLQEVA
jgi:hypothetical protein